ncbi:uncharacterized protein LOC121295873 [Polyodon spathula]|uniref:uncharacterized protein LOC121295873 n=1 Tax=Polyodon spathula TaxID=7913 RepID=UPI001B7DE9CB|nr:uncharacterized protein LOC121295873 [Polyodon spathula]
MSVVFGLQGFPGGLGSADVHSVRTPELQCSLQAVSEDALLVLVSQLPVALDRQAKSTTFASHRDTEPNAAITPNEDIAMHDVTTSPRDEDLATAAPQTTPPLQGRADEQGRFDAVFQDPSQGAGQYEELLKDIIAHLEGIIEPPQISPLPKNTDSKFLILEMILRELYSHCKITAEKLKEKEVDKRNFRRVLASVLEVFEGWDSGMVLLA